MALSAIVGLLCYLLTYLPVWSGVRDRYCDRWSQHCNIR